MLNFVDLAGSEKLSSHYNGQEDSVYTDSLSKGTDRSLSKNDPKVKDRIKESKNINKSLFFLT